MDILELVALVMTPQVNLSPQESSLGAVDLIRVNLAHHIKLCFKVVDSDQTQDMVFWPSYTIFQIFHAQN